MKKILTALLISCLVSFSSVSAEENSNAVKDIPADFWAKQQVEAVLSDNIMQVDSEGNFNPDKPVSRIEFVSALLKILSNDNLDVNIKNKFSDINDKQEFYNDVLRSEQLGLVYGYPDGTFQPQKTMLKSETTSVISHITKDKFIDCAILDKYSDNNDIPSWAKIPYAKSINYGIYINYPDENKLEPNRNITRAETAVLLTRLKDKLSLVKPQYIPQKEELLSVEHLNMVKKPQENKINITNQRKIILQGNAFPISFESAFQSKNANEGDVVYFIFNQAIKTDEGSVLIPQGSKLTSEVTMIEQPRKFNHCAKVFLEYKQITFPDGTNYDISAKTYNKDSALKESNWLTGLKYASIVGAFTKGLSYKSKKGEIVNILLSEDLSLVNPEKMEK